MLAVLCALAFGLVATDAQAAPINLTVGDAFYLGFYTPPEPASLADEAGYINTLLGLGPGGSLVVPDHPKDRTFTRQQSTLVATSLPLAVVPGAAKVNIPDGSPYTGTAINVTGFTYLVGKYDGQNAGGYVWLVSGLTEVTIPTKLGNLTSTKGSTHALSHYSLFNPTTSVPDGGMTLMLLGGALVGLEGLRRRFRI